MPGLECQLRQMEERHRRPDRGEQRRFVSSHTIASDERSADEPHHDGHDARGIVRHGNPHQGVQDLLPEVIGRSVLRVDLVVERETLKELLDGEEQIPFVVVILELREHESMAEPRERTQRTAAESQTVARLDRGSACVVMSLILLPCSGSDYCLGPI